MTDSLTVRKTRKKSKYTEKKEIRGGFRGSYKGFGGFLRYLHYLNFIPQ